MPVFRLTRKILAFPPPEHSEPDGLLAVGGDLSPQRILLAYRSGIFPWYSKGMPILWWSPDPRMVLFPEELRISHSLRRVLKKGTYDVTFDSAFRDVMMQCAEVRREKGEDTWILPEMVAAYARLHELGYAHSAEAWHEGELAGGLYGIALGGVFFGESMFMRRPDASKVAFVRFVELLRRRNFRLIDCQMTTRHLQNFGAREIAREEFLRLLGEALQDPAPSEGEWPHFLSDA